jgi:L-iditol 2-dehydrogenase
MKAAILTAPMEFEIRDFPIPQPGVGQVVIRVKASGVCPSGLKLIKQPQRMPDEFWQIPGAPGHEVSAEVVEISKEVIKWSTGDRIVVTGGPTCGKCHYCLRGQFRFCENRVFTNMSHMGFSEYMACSEDELVAIPDGVSDEEASLAEPLACVVGSVEKCHIKAGDTVAVVGCGVMGQLHIQIMNALGARVIAIDIDENRRAFGVKSGALQHSPPGKAADELVKEISDGRGAETVIVAAGTPEAAESAFPLVGPGGTILFFAGIWPADMISIDPNFIHYQQINITGSVGGMVADFQRALAWISSNRINVQSLITGRFSLEEIIEAHKICEKGIGYKNLIIP